MKGEATETTQAGGARDLQDGACSKGGKMGLAPGIILRTGLWKHLEDKPAGSANSLDVEWERKRRVRMISRFLT